jgi:hypothetical protein
MGETPRLQAKPSGGRRAGRADARAQRGARVWPPIARHLKAGASASGFGAPRFTSASADCGAQNPSPSGEGDSIGAGRVEDTWILIERPAA